MGLDQALKVPKGGKGKRKSKGKGKNTKGGGKGKGGGPGKGTRLVARYAGSADIYT